MRLRVTMLAALLAACGGDDPAEKPAAENPAAENPAAGAPAKAPEKTFTAAELAAAAEEVALVPRPAEMEKALANAGINARLGDMVSDRDISTDHANLDQVAVRTGVVLADLVLTAKTAPKEKTVHNLEKLKQGFKKVGAGNDIQVTIDEMIASVNNDALKGTELVQEMDELSGVLVPELETEAGDWVVPLIQAGSWLEGAHLVSGALKAESKYDAADGMLRQPAVVDYFIKYVDREGGEKAPDEVVAKLKETLKTLKEVASKPKLEQADVETIHSATGAVLTML
jgi:hypothetical protein